MGNCLSTCQDCLKVIRKRNITEPKIDDQQQLLLKRILMLEDQAAEQEYNIKMLKTQLSRLEVRRLCDSKKMQSLGQSIREARDTLERSPSAVSIEEMEYRIDEIGKMLKDLRLKSELHGSMIRELNKKENRNKKDDEILIDVLERGIKEGKRHLENLEVLFEPVCLFMDSDNSLRQLMQDKKYSTKTTRI